MDHMEKEFDFDEDDDDQQTMLDRWDSEQVGDMDDEVTADQIGDGPVLWSRVEEQFEKKNECVKRWIPIKEFKGPPTGPKNIPADADELTTFVTMLGGRERILTKGCYYSNLYGKQHFKNFKEMSQEEYDAVIGSCLMMGAKGVSRSQAFRSYLRSSFNYFRL